MMSLNKEELPAFYPVICVSASKWISDFSTRERSHGYTYVQGAGTFDALTTYEPFTQ